VLPSRIQARTFELLGAVPLRMDLTEAIAKIVAGEIDAQENPLSNTVTYGVHKFHRFHTLTNHFYISRPIFVHRAAFDAWPDDVQHVMREAVRAAVAFQRAEAIREHEEAYAAIVAQGCEIAPLPRAAHEAFVKAAQPLHDAARQSYGRQALALIGRG
jgi:TRAP-type transport system periplasmic protein